MSCRSGRPTWWTMPRTLATILMLLTAVGPAPCCCPVIVSLADEPASPAPAAPAPCGCCHCQTQTPQPAPTTDKAPRPPRNPAQPCPCLRLRDARPALHVLTAAGAGLDLSGTAAPLDWLPVTATEPVAAVRNSGSDPPLPFLTAQALLRTHHQLRC